MSLRQSIIEEIALLSDPSRQLQYEKDVQIADIPAELICGFCDDLYHPGSPELTSQFTTAEISRLDQLFGILSQVANLQVRSVAELQDHSSWQAVVSNAKELYAHFSGST